MFAQSFLLCCRSTTSQHCNGISYTYIQVQIVESPPKGHGPINDRSYIDNETHIDDIKIPVLFVAQFQDSVSLVGSNLTRGREQSLK